MTSPFSERKRQPAMMEQWHTFGLDEVKTRLQTASGGLSEAEARQRLARYGPNLLATPKRRGPLLRLVMQFHNILLYVMMGAAVVTAVLGHWIDTGVLLGAVVKYHRQSRWLEMVSASKAPINP